MKERLTSAPSCDIQFERNRSSVWNLQAARETVKSSTKVLLASFPAYSDNI